MKFSKRAIAIGSMAAAVTLGTAGIVTAAGVQGHGPASALSSLVSDGTITQEQADKVADALKKNREGMKAEHEAQRAEMKALITKTLGISETDLETARKEGKSLGEIAGDKRDELVAAMVAFQTAKLDKAVADGKVTQVAAQESWVWPSKVSESHTLGAESSSQCIFDLGSVGLLRSCSR